MDPRLVPNDDALLTKLARTLATVPGVAAIVLGGSRARGRAGPRSDYDIGLYYDPDRPIDIAALRGVVAGLDDAGPKASVTAPGGWGPWIDGGGWLTVSGTRVDLLYRDLARVRGVIAACRDGRVQRVYQPGHPHAFVSAIYMGEVAYCRALWDPSRRIGALKGLTDPYPEPLRRALVDTFLWEAEFALGNARHGRGLDDTAYVAGCGFRCVACLCQVLFAANGAYLVNEKGAVSAAAELPRCPPGFGSRVEAAFRAVGTGRRAEGVEMLEALVREAEAISEGDGSDA